MANFNHLSTVLIVEDEALIALDLETTLGDCGVARVLAASTIADALVLIETNDIDAAILDLRLGSNDWTYGIAAALTERGIPFIFSSGTSSVATGFEQVPLVGKPFSEEQLLEALQQVAPRPLAKAAQ